MDDIEKLIARKIFQVLHEQQPGDVAELLRLAETAQQRGYTTLAAHAREMAALFAAEDDAGSTR